MKFQFGLFVLILGAQAYSQEFMGFETKISSYKDYHFEQSFDGSRVYDFECVNTFISTWDGKTTRKTSFTIGKYIENSSNSGLNITYNSQFEFFNGFETVTGFDIGISSLEFTDNDTLVVSSESRGINEREATPVFRESKAEIIKKLIDGHVVTVKRTIDGEESTQESKKIDISHDPFNTKYTLTSENIRSEEYDEIITRSISRSSCTYKQVGLDTYLDFIPKVLTGSWNKIDELSGESEVVSFGKEGQLHEIKGNLILFNGSKYKMNFFSPNTVRFTDLATGDESLLKRVRD